MLSPTRTMMIPNYLFDHAIRQAFDAVMGARPALKTAYCPHKLFQRGCVRQEGTSRLH